MIRRTIAYFVHGHGRGHASRALAIVPRLCAADFDVQLYASGEASTMLRELAPREARQIEPGPGVVRKLVEQARVDRKALRALAPRLVISDGYQPALLAARSLRVPSLAIGHDLVFTRCRLPPRLPARYLAHQRINAFVPTWLSTRRIAVHFLPIESADPATTVARADAAPAASDVPRRMHVVPYFRDPNGERALALLREQGIPLAQVGDGSARARVAPEVFRELLRSAVGAVGSAGSNLLAECVLFNTPLLALYRQDDAEQALNALLLEAAGVGMACTFERLDAEVVRAFWERARAGRFASLALAQALPSVADVALREARALAH